MLASWLQAYLIDEYCLIPAACNASPSRLDTTVRSRPPAPDCQLEIRLCMLVGTLSAPPFSASLAAEMTLPLALLVPPPGAVPPVDPAVPRAVAPGGRTARGGPAEFRRPRRLSTRPTRRRLRPLTARPKPPAPDETEGARPSERTERTGQRTAQFPPADYVVLGRPGWF